MKAWWICTRFRIERRLAMLPYRRIGAVAFILAGSAACVSSGLGVFMEASTWTCFLSMVVGLAYNGIGAMLWGLE